MQPLKLDSKVCYQAILSRDCRFDGAFVYAVHSTGIYCRPTCASRRPKPEGVTFYLHPDAAEQAGFRACLRCKPQKDVAQNPHVSLVERACRFIDNNLESSLALGDLSATIGINPQYLQRVFKRITGISPRQYIDARRLSYLKAQLKNGQNITQALYEAGYGSSSRLYERAFSQFGMTPAAYRKGGEGVRINYTINDCKMGRLLVAATERGICIIKLGNSDATLKAELFSEYPAAEICYDSNLTRLVNTQVNVVDCCQEFFKLPPDIQATIFQRIVWQVLQNSLLPHLFSELRNQTITPIAAFGRKQSFAYKRNLRVGPQ